VEVRLARGPEEVEQALDLRERVFCGEQGVTLEADRDGLDGEATHIVAVAGGRVAGTCRLVFRSGTAHLGRMAVDPAVRRGGLGRALLDEAEKEARVAGARRVRLHAQTAIMDLYANAGYVPYGDVFIEEGIEHITMEKLIA
jgi:predicted GNAT family N-acyltransferase